ncbi:DUF3426 domain-containing protein [Halobacteria archaeon AArc-dxtr1]|nr:DUF3426 domain-containing protein [Halobacteria archaeon AArc-dxtr1]
MKRRAFVAALVLLPGCTRVFEENGEITEPGDVEIVWSSLIREDPGTDEERVVVQGIVRNVGERTLSYIEVRATFLDADGEELTSVVANVDEDVSTGSEWEFEIEFPDFGERAARVETYELEPATGV